MNLDSLSFALAEISYSVANLTKKNFRSSVAEINHLVSQHGAEADRHLFRCLFSHVDFSSDGKSAGKDFHQTQFLIQECTSLLSKPNFVSTLCFAIDSPLHHQKTLKPSPHLFPQISKLLRLTRVQEVVFGLAFLQSSNQEIQNHAIQFVKQKLPDLIRSYVDADSSLRQEGGLQDVAIEVLHLLLAHLIQSREQFGIGIDQKEAFLATLRKDFPRDRVPVVIGPLLYPETEDISVEKLMFITSMPKTHLDASLADMILESGFSCTSSVEECRNMVVQFGQKEVTPAVVARVLGMMARNPSSLPDQPQQVSVAPGSGWGDIGKDKIEQPGVNTWNVENFIQTIQDLFTSHMNWREVVSEMDFPQFLVANKRGLRLLMKGLIQGLQEIFPVEYIYRPWKNTEGQLSLIIQSLRNPDVFCFADYPCHSVVIDILKTAPDDEKRDIATWKSLDLVELLLRLSEQGHYQQVSELFKFPIQNCPDMLVLALLQISPSWNTLKQELISMLMPMFLGNHPNSAVVLHYAWHCQGLSSTIRTLIMHSMAEWYMRGEPHDQTRLSRILDVAQDLKALSMLLNATPFAFVIDLACLASRREYLKLDKWLSDKIREHREPFIQTCVTFLKRRCPQLVGNMPKDDLTSRSQQLPPETIKVMLSCLQGCASNVSPELNEVIVMMINHASVLLRQTAVGPKPPNPMASGPPVGPSPSMPPVGVSLGGGANTGLGLGPNMAQNAMASMAAGPSSQLDQADTLGIPKSWGVPGQGSTGFASLGVGGSTNQTPGSPAKGFPSQANSGFGAMQNLTSQLQNLTMPSSSGLSGLMAPRAPGAPGVNTLGSLSAQQVMKQQGPQPTPTPPQQPIQPQVPTDVSSLFPDMNQQFTKEVEDEANSYFQRIYNQPPHPTMSIDEVLDMLKRFKDSAVRKEKDVYECMLRNLFEEYQFFPKYPDRELHTTAVLFGGIIEKGLATYMALGIALRYVLEALKKQHGSKMYYFGIAALDRFKTRLKDYPSYCQHLAAIPHFSQFPQPLIEFVEYGAQNQEPPQLAAAAATSRSLTPVTASLNLLGGQSMFGMGGNLGAPSSVSNAMSAGLESTFNMMSMGTMTSIPTTTVTVTTATASTPATTTTAKTGNMPKPSIASATNIDTLLAGQDKEEVVVPSEAIQDRVFFIFNNLSMSNMTQKSEELKKEVKEEHRQWMAQYLVMKRASIEPNFHTLYANFVDALNIKDVAEMVILEAFRNIKVLLKSDKGDANFSDRTLLKNLGHWLGMLTLAKNKPILQIDIDLKNLIYEAYHKGARELLYVVPFTAKVLESCGKSKVFRPPNPWIMGIMNVLAELHQEPDLKLNLKFEIEVLCKTLMLDLGDLKPGNYLKDTSRLANLEIQLSINKPLVSQVSAPPPQTISTPQPPEPPVVPTLTNVTPTVTTTSITASTTPSSTPSLPPQPQFAFDDIIVTSLAGLATHIVINEQLGVFQANPQLKQYVRVSIERAVQDLLPPVVERSLKIALTTCEQIIRKDFALDPDENRMRVAAHHMVRSMTSGLTLYTCREPLFLAISTNLKTAFMNTLRQGASQQQKELIEQAAMLVAQDNIELASAFIQKTAVERAIPEMDKRLAADLDSRKAAREKGIRFCEPITLTYQAERMPEQIRLKVGGETPQQIAVYEEYARNIPGFLPLSELNLPAGLAKPMPSYPASEELMLIYEKIAREIEQSISQAGVAGTNPLLAQMRALLDTIMMAGASRDLASAMALLQKATEGLMEQFTARTQDQKLMLRFRDCHLLVLNALQDQRAFGPQWTSKHVTRCVSEGCREEHRFNLEAVDILIQSQLVNLNSYDMYLFQLMESDRNGVAITFAMQLVQRYCVDDKRSGQITEADFANTIEFLSYFAGKSRQLPAGLTNLLENLRQTPTTGGGGEFGMLDRAPGGGGPTFMMQSGITQAREIEDPPGLHEKTEYLLREWVNMYHSPAAGRDSTKAFSAFVQQMHQQGILKTDDLITRFFRLCTEMCVDLCYRALSEQTHNSGLVRAKCFHTLDAFVRLITLLVKHSGDTANSVTKINLLNKVLGIVAGVLLQDHEVRKTEFQQLPYHRIFIMLFIELNAPDIILENINFQVLTAFCNTFHVLRPTKAPGFCFAWLELISHRVFVGRMLALTPQQRAWGMYAQLLIDLFKFLHPFLRNAELTKPIHFLYKGTLRVLLVLLHDFPEFLCDYHYAFCDIISTNCIQMRNLILSAFPRNMRLPDPFTPNLKVDMLADIAHAPRIPTNFANMITPVSFKNDLDSYLKTRSPVTFLSDLRSSLQSNEPGSRYNISLMNALVLYVGTQAIQHIHTKSLTPSMSTIAHSSHMDIFQNLAVDLDTEGRYLFLTALANQLRYPNSHTHYFSCTLLYLFAEANTEAIQEQITRVLLERLIVNRPHPWGLLITFIELIKNPQFKFWTHEFVHCAPEIEKLFESVARSCIQKGSGATPSREQEAAELH
ncbi:CCR4-NOT transcription complex subunit 1-like isoform X2 [Mya arenaria]|uniref:CCR4-NOT transcription complex subunit 1-like isoform X2 n=1 Tax=Mya arenaria TaxID=6604 RepID=UPI0022E7C158|nr:CCR4-NOT transcription complex subunit 1-like isoform X2 [Mya arenaria]